MTALAALTVREARRGDCKEILRLIQELAVFQKLPNGPTINEKDLERDGFDADQPFFSCYVIEDPGDALKLVAYAMFYQTFAVWTGRRMYLQDLYVSDTFRGKGVGNLLFKTVVQNSKGTNCMDMAWIVENWNPSTDFFKAKGACDVTIAEAWHVYRLGPQAMKTVAGQQPTQV